MTETRDNGTIRSMEKLIQALQQHKRAIRNMRNAVDKTARVSRFSDRRKKASARSEAYTKSLMHIDMAIEEAMQI